MIDFNLTFSARSRNVPLKHIFSIVCAFQAQVARIPETDIQYPFQFNLYDLIIILNLSQVYNERGSIRGKIN